MITVSSRNRRAAARQRWRAVVLLALATLARSALAAPAAAPDPARIAAELQQHLRAHGAVCLGKVDWPIEVTERDVRFQLRDALQMPVLERLGLVSAELGTAQRQHDDATETVAVRRYTLTATGRTYFLARPQPPAAAARAAPAPQADLCAGQLELDRVVGWRPSAPDGGELEVSYTYHFTPAEWFRDPGAQRVFPVVAQLLRAQGTARMQQRFVWTDGRWAPVDPRAAP